MAISNISGYSSTEKSAAQVANKSSELGKNDFLELLVTQLRYQDPMSPMDDTQFISQMATFSSLEQMQNMNMAMTATQATSMIGKKVTWTEAGGQSLSGNVSSVLIEKGTPYLVVGDYSVELAKVSRVEEAVKTTG